MLARVQIEHEVGQRTFELRAQVPINCKARAGELHRAFQIQNAQFRSQIPMRLGSEIELRRRPPASHFHVLFCAVAHGHAGVRKVRNARENVLQANVEIGGSFLPRLDLLAQIFCLGDRCRGILPALF